MKPEEIKELFDAWFKKKYPDNTDLLDLVNWGPNRGYAHPHLGPMYQGFVAGLTLKEQKLH